MNKKVLIIVLIIVVSFIIVTIYILKNKGKNINNSNNAINSGITGNIDKTENIEKNNINKNIESEEIMNKSIKAVIDDKTYSVTLENNETAKQFLNMLPQDFNMSELNGNEKYVYLENALPTNTYNPEHIETGDIMLYGNNCLVVFYKSFNTPYNYTKIGHIDNLNELGNKNISIKFKEEN